MRQVAAWLVARPQNAVIGLAATLLLPILQIASGIIMVLLVLRNGARLAVIEGLAAGALLALVALIAQAPMALIAGAALGVWAPAVLAAVVLQTTRSLALTLQVGALLAAGATAGYFAVIGDLVAHWQPVIDFLVEWSRSNGLPEQAAIMEGQPEMFADMLTMVTVAANWTMYVVYLLAGHWLFKALPGETRNYGRFCDLNFGRVIALITAILSLLAFAFDAAWLEGTAFVLFAVFWLQGLAVVHWMHSDAHLPVFVVIATYVLLPVLHLFLVTALALLGYTDAWFGLRRRAVLKQ